MTDRELLALHDERERWEEVMEDAEIDIAALYEEARGLRAAINERLEQIAEQLVWLNETLDECRDRIEDVRDELGAASA